MYMYIQQIKQKLIDFHFILSSPSQEYSITHVLGSIVWYYRDDIELNLISSYFSSFQYLKKKSRTRALDQLKIVTTKSMHVLH